ncbi:MAG: VWA domain-containing protein [Bryobacteraceae bacterium]
MSRSKTPSSRENARAHIVVPPAAASLFEIVAYLEQRIILKRLERHSGSKAAGAAASHLPQAVGIIPVANRLRDRRPPRLPGAPIVGPKTASLLLMRVAAAILLFTCLGCAQFRSTAPLVVAPTTVTDSKGRFVDGLAPDDLILFDNNVPQTIQMDWMTYPIDLVVAVQTSSNSGAVIDKLGGSGILFTQLLAADAGETAVISFSDEVQLHQDFTGNPDSVIHALRMLRMEGGGAHMLDALRQALLMLERRPPGRRRIILMIAERRDRSSQAKLPEVMEQVERLNAAIYWLTYSPMLQPFTVKPKTAEDLKPEAERIKGPQCAGCPAPDDTPVPPDLGPGGFLYTIGELIRLHQPDLSSLFARITGGRTLNFLKKNALEQAIQLVGEEVHRQYILSFEPKGGEPGKFHAIRVAVKNRPELQAKTREGYWALQ